MTKVAFTPSPALQQLAAIFADNQKSLRIVGGAVRDLLLGKEPKDIDLCTDATPDQMIAMAEAAKITLIPTGLQHGTVTFVIDGEAFEVTTLRIDSEADGRHAEVTFTKSFEEDAARRDLTINAMSMDLDGTVYDYFDGIRDLKKYTIRFVGDPAARVQEDYLRILRFFRFMARFRSHGHSSSLLAIMDHAAGLSQISKERVWSEISQILMSPGRQRVMAEMEYSGVLNHIGFPADFRWPLPVTFKPRHDEDDVHSLIERADCSVTAISLYVHSDAEQFGRSWKMSLDEIKKLVWLVSMRNQRVYIHWIEDQLVGGTPRDWVVSRCKLYNDNRLTFHAQTWEIPTFPVRGQDLLDAGLKPGKEVGIRMDHIKRTWIASRFKLTKEELLCD